MVEEWEVRINARQVLGQLQAQAFPANARPCPMCGQLNAKVCHTFMDLINVIQLFYRNKFVELQIIDIVLLFLKIIATLAPSGSPLHTFF